MADYTGMPSHATSSPKAYQEPDTTGTLRALSDGSHLRAGIVAQQYRPVNLATGRDSLFSEDAPDLVDA